MARGVWQEKIGLKFNDPYADWLTTISEEIDDLAAWVPVVLPTDRLILPVDSDDQIVFISNLFKFVKCLPADKFRINGHDFIHWIIMALSGRAELIVFIFGKRSNIAANIKVLIDDAKGVGIFVRDEDRFLVGASISVGFPQKFELNLENIRPLLDKFLAPREIRLKNPKVVKNQEDGRQVITGIIDHAIGFAHTRFRLSATETRVAAVWAQQGNDKDSTVVGIGREISGSEIDDWLTELNEGILIDESEIYRKAGLIEHGMGILKSRGDQPLSLSRTHGTQMLDIAAGREFNDGLAKQNPILAVQLPAEVVARTNGFLHEPYVKSAMNWIWFKTLITDGFEFDNLVVNYSFGDYAGSHDGFDILDADFERRIDQGEIGMVTVPVGNGYLSETHAKFIPGKLETINEFELVVQPDDKEATFMQIWLDDDMAGTTDNSIPLQLEIETPNSIIKAAAERKAGSHDDLIVTGEVVARVYYQKYQSDHVGASPKARNLITVAIRPTASDSPDYPVAPAGKWKFKLSTEAQGCLGDVINIWVERGDSIEGFPPSGRQAYLDHKNHIRYNPDGRLNEEDTTDCPISRFGTISSSANAKSTFVAGSYRENRQKRMAYYSAARSKQQVHQPKLSFPSELSAARPNVLASGTNSGSISGARGTSAASAMAARSLVEDMLDTKNSGQIGTKGAGKKARRRIEGVAQANKPISSVGVHDAPRFPDERAGKGLSKSTYVRTPVRVISD